MVIIFKKSSNDIIKFSKIESKRFNKRIFRGLIDYLDENILLSKLLSENIDILILRIPSEKIYQISNLEKLKIPFIVADTLVYYYLDLNIYTPNNLKNNDLIFIKGKPENEKIINHLVEKIFSNYQNHYTSNPFLNTKSILNGYKEWARSYIDPINKEKICFLVKRDGNFIGFATCSYNERTKEGEGVLYGVVDSASGQGIYGDLIRYTQKYLKNIGCNVMKVSTQVQNFAVQKVWAREGFIMKKAYNTIHINSLFDCSMIPKEDFQIKIPKEVNLEFLKISKNVNLNDNENFVDPSDFDTTNRLISVLNPIINRYVNSKFKDIRLELVGYQYKLLEPIEFNKTYTISISFPFINEIEGVYKSIISILNEDERISLYSYYEFSKKRFV
ncbi:MAG: GNAT family N-acetyltransferase [Candidatus Lokiarchaeota archaeon]